MLKTFYSRYSKKYDFSQNINFLFEILSKVVVKKMEITFMAVAFSKRSMIPERGSFFDEAVLTSTHNLCFGAKIRKIVTPLHTPVSLYEGGVYGGIHYTDMFS